MNRNQLVIYIGAVLIIIILIAFFGFRKYWKISADETYTWVYTGSELDEYINNKTDPDWRFLNAMNGKLTDNPTIGVMRTGVLFSLKGAQDIKIFIEKIDDNFYITAAYIYFSSANQSNFDFKFQANNDVAFYGKKLTAKTINEKYENNENLKNYATFLANRNYSKTNKELIVDKTNNYGQAADKCKDILSGIKKIDPNNPPSDLKAYFDSWEYEGKKTLPKISSNVNNTLYQSLVESPSYSTATGSTNSSSSQRVIVESVQNLDDALSALWSSDDAKAASGLPAAVGAAGFLGTPLMKLAAGVGVAGNVTVQALLYSSGAAKARDALVKAAVTKYYVLEYRDYLDCIAKEADKTGETVVKEKAQKEIEGIDQALSSLDKEASDTATNSSKSFFDTIISGFQDAMKEYMQTFLKWIWGLFDEVPL